VIDWASIASGIGSATGQSFQLVSHAPIGGGCINQAYRILGQDGRCFFIKLNSADKEAMLSAEAAGLNEIAKTQTIRVPQPITVGISGKQCYLVLEHLELTARGNAKLLGQQLAALHRYTSLSLPTIRGKDRMGVEKESTATLPCFGFAQDNFIGSTPQPNGWKTDWIAFWREHRLGYQLQLAAQNGYGGRLQTLGEELMEALPVFFDGYTPKPSLLHGDLWSGNHSFLSDGTPTIFDPASYYGDRECDLAMTELFGGYSTGFYSAYRAAYPLDAGYSTRRDLYNLYHILNHANLFGVSYVSQAEQIMQKLLTKVG